MKLLIYRKDNHSFVVSEIGKRFTPNNVANKLHRRAARAEQERISTMIAPNNQWRHLDDSLVAPTTLGDIKITPEQQLLYAKDYTIHVENAYIRFNSETKQLDVSRYNIDIMTGGRMPFVPGAHPEYEAFYNGLTGLDKEAFKRFRRSHPTLTNQEAMSMFKLNYGHYHHMGMLHGL